MSPLKRFLRRVGEIAQEEESGQAMTEFVIVFPVQFFFILAIMQFSLINLAVIVVNHAAFKAARSYLVADERSGGATQNARDAATFVLCSIAGNKGFEGGGAARSYPSEGKEVKLFRWAAAEAKTEVTASYSDDKRYVGVAVTHQYELIIPVVNHFFVRWNNGWNLGAANPSTEKWGKPHLDITESCYLPCPWRPKNE